MPCTESDSAVAPEECQLQRKSDPCGGGTRGRALCGIRTPFWWYGGRDGATRPGGDPAEYEPKPRREVRIAEDNVLQRLEADCVDRYLPGQVAAAAHVAADGFGEGVEDEDGKNHEHCPCRRETWVRGGPLLGHRPDPARGCQCPCCLGPAPPPPPPGDAPPPCSAPPRQTWRARPPFWWWCHDQRSQRPGGDPALYAPVLPAKLQQPQAPLAQQLELDQPDFYLPGQVVFGFKPALCRYGAAETAECLDEYLRLSRLEAPEALDAALRCGAAPSCSEHGGRPWHPALLPDLLQSEVPGARCTAPQRSLRRPQPCTCAAEACSTCCRRSAAEMSGVLPYGWRGWPGVKKAHILYPDLQPCQRLAHCTRCKC